MWSIYVHSLDHYLAHMELFARGFLTLMITEWQGHCPDAALPKLLFLAMPSTLLHEGMRSRPRIDHWNQQVISVLDRVVDEVQRTEGVSLSFQVVDYFAPTEMRPERSDGNHFGDWMREGPDGRPPVLCKGNLNTIMNYIC